MKENNMKRNITSVIIIFLIFFIPGVLCTGCGKEAEAESGEGSGIKAGEVERGEESGLEVLPEMESASEESAEQSESGMAENKKYAGEEKEYTVLQEELCPTVLQIFCGDYRGSGAVWEITDREVTVISSAHLLKNGDTCEVLCHAGVYYEAKVDRILENCDVGFAVFPADVLRADGVGLAAVESSERTARELAQGEELIVYGSMQDVAADFVKGYLIKAESKIQIDGYNNAQPLLLGAIIREAGRGEKGAVDAGMSGSGVFDRYGKLLGILSGGDGESGFAAVPIWRIEEEMDEAQGGI